jgi:hypothetical protein
MGTHRLSFDEFLNLPEEPGKHYELSQGELVAEGKHSIRASFGLCIRSQLDQVIFKLGKRRIQ